MKFANIQMQKIAVLLIILTIEFSIVKGQTCSCNVFEVISNSVPSCTLTKGETAVVSNTNELKNALKQANASQKGFTILLQDGIYDVSYTNFRFNIEANEIVVRSLSGNRDKVILQGSGMRDINPQVENGITINGKKTVIADLTIRKVANHGIQIQNHHATIYNVKIEDCYQQMIKGSSFNPQIDSSIIQCCHFEYTNGIGPNFYIGGVDAHVAKDWIVSDNYFKNIASPSRFVAEHAIHFWNNSSGSIAERNIILNCDRGIGFGLGNSFHYGGIIRNNMIYNDGKHPFNDTGIGLESAPDSRIYNNTIYIQYPNAIEYRFPESKNIEIINNLCNKNIRNRDNAQATAQNNLLSADLNWFIEPQHGNLLLKNPIVGLTDMGIDLEKYVADDILKTKRPVTFWQPGFDIGAHEFKNTSSTNHWNKKGNKKNGSHESGIIYKASCYNLSGNLIKSFYHIGFEYNFEGQLPEHNIYIILYFDRNNQLLYSRKILQL